MTLLALKNLFRNKRRTFLTSATIISGMIMLLLALAYVEYVKWGMGESTIRSETGHFQIAEKKFWTGTNDEPLENGMDNWKVTADTIAMHKNVSSVMPQIDFSGLLSSGERTQGVFISAVVPEDIITRGSVFINSKPYETLITQKDGIILGKRLAEYLNVTVGDTVTVMTNTEQGGMNAIDIPVVALTGSVVSEMSKRFAVMHLSSAQSLLNTSKVQKLVVSLYDSGATDKTMHEVAALLPESTELRGWKSLAMMYRQVVGFFYQIIGFMTMVLVMLVWFSSSNTQLMSVLERTGEFAAMQALGTDRHRVVKLILTESVLLALVCAVVAILSEYGVSSLLNSLKIIMPAPPGQERGYQLGFRNETINFVIVTVGTVFVVVSSAVAPAMRMVRQNIAEGLRRYV